MELWGIIFGKEIQFVENFEIVGCALLQNLKEMEICEWCYCLTWSYQIHMCEVVDSIRMGTSNVGHVDAKLDPNSLKRKSKTI